MNDIDELMARDPLDLSDQDIDAIIAYHRAQRAKRAAGEKTARPAGPVVDISNVVNNLLKEKTPKVVVKRRV